MRYGVREICNVVIKDIVTKEPVVYLESLTTSSFEGTAQTVYARGGRGHAKLIGWDSEKDITASFEDALISKASLGMLVGDTFKTSTRPIRVKEVLTVTTETTDKIVTLSKTPVTPANPNHPTLFYKTEDGTTIGEKLTATVTALKAKFSGGTLPDEGDLVIVEYYTAAPAKAQSLTISSDKFAGTYMLEAETLWRNENGIDVPAIYTIPKMKMSSDWTLSMASSGDPETFAFTADVLKDTKSTAMIMIDLLEE